MNAAEHFCQKYRRLLLAYLTGEGAALGELILNADTETASEQELYAVYTAFVQGFLRWLLFGQGRVN